MGTNKKPSPSPRTQKLIDDGIHTKEQLAALASALDSDAAEGRMTKAAAKVIKRCGRLLLRARKVAQLEAKLQQLKVAEGVQW